MKCFCKIPSLVVSLGLWVLIVSVAVVPRAKAQSPAPGTGISGNRIIATTAGTLGLHSVMAGQTLDLRGVNFSGSEYTCTTGKGFWDVPAGNQTTINNMRDDWHANVIRLPLNEICWLGINGAPPATSGLTTKTRWALL